MKKGKFFEKKLEKPDTMEFFNFFLVISAKNIIKTTYYFSSNFFIAGLCSSFIFIKNFFSQKWSGVVKVKEIRRRDKNLENKNHNNLYLYKTNRNNSKKNQLPKNLSSDLPTPLRDFSIRQKKSNLYSYQNLNSILMLKNSKYFSYE